MEIVTQIEFARMAGITKQAVASLIATRTIKKEKDKAGKSGINLDAAKTKIYLSSKTSKIEIRKIKKKAKAAKAAKTKQKSKKPAKEKEEKEPDKKVSSDLDKAEAGLIRAAESRELLEMEKIRAQTVQIKLKTAAEMKKIIPTELVEKIFMRISGGFAIHFLTMGERLAGQLAGIAGTVEPEKVLAIKQKIDDDQSRSIQELKKTISLFLEELI